MLFNDGRIWVVLLGYEISNVIILGSMGIVFRPQEYSPFFFMVPARLNDTRTRSVFFRFVFFFFTVVYCSSFLFNDIKYRFDLIELFCPVCLVWNSIPSCCPLSSPLQLYLMLSIRLIRFVSDHYL